MRGDGSRLRRVHAAATPLRHRLVTGPLATGATAEEALRTVTRGTDGFWIHLDFDVIDESQMPAVDCPEPDGLLFAEISQLLGHLGRSPSCAGIELTIYDPDLDPAGQAAKAVVACLGSAFQDRLALADTPG